VGRTKIDTDLSAEQRDDFYQRCRKAKGGFTGPVIQAIGADFGLTLTHDSANNIRKHFIARYEAELAEHADLARAVATAAQHGMGLNDAAAVKLSLKINDDLDRDDELTIGDKNKYSLAIARLRAGDQRGQMVEMLKQRLNLQQFDAAQAAITHAREIRAITADQKLDDGQKTERVRKILFGAQPADFAPVPAGGAPATPEGKS
jgi:hypothetical protein